MNIKILYTYFILLYEIKKNRIEIQIINGQ